MAKYLFGTSDRCAIFIDPVPGAPEPSPDAITESGEGSSFPNLQVIVLKSPVLATQGQWNLDSLRVGTNWADVTPVPTVLTVFGPENQAACAGSPVTFSVSAIGSAPFIYQWRANGIEIPAATNSSYTLPSPSPADAAKTYDVVIHDASNVKTSAVVSLTLSTTAPNIISAPSDQLGISESNATFSVVATGDQPLVYQWRTNGVPIPDATNETYTLVGTRSG